MSTLSRIFIFKLGLYTALLMYGLSMPPVVQAETEADGEETVISTAVATGESLWGPRSPRKIYLTLKECLKRAMIYNRELKAFDYDIRKAEAKFKEADIIGRPVLEYENLLGPAPRDVSNAVGSFFSGDITVLNRFKVGMGVPLTTFGKIKRAKALAEGGIEAEGFKRIKKESEIVFKVHQLYYGVLLAREVNRLLRYALKESNKEIKKREDEGGGDPVALLKLKIFRSDMDKKIQESHNKEILALEALRVLLGLDRSQSFDLQHARLFPVGRSLKSFEHYRGLAYRQRADVKLLEIGLNSRRLNYELEKYRFAPNLGVGAFFEVGRAPGVTGVTTTDDYSDPFNYTRAGFGFQLKGKFDYGTRTAKIRQAEAEFNKTRLQVDLAADGILLEVKKAYLTVKAAREELHRSEESSKLARQVLFLTQSNFDIGLAEPKDLIDAISGFMKTRGEYFKAVFDYNVAFAELDQKIDSIPELNS